MEDIGTLWTFQESIDELKQKLEYMTYELEMTKKKANEEMSKNEEKIRKLLQLLQAAFKERDEAKAQLHKLQQVLPFINNTNNYNINKPCSFDQLIPFSPDTPLLTNSSLTESQSQSLSHVSSPVMDSLSYPPQVPSSSDSINIHNGLKPKLETTQMMMMMMTEPNRVIDEGSLIIEKLAKGRPLPQKGKLLQAVLEAGPLLQNLMVSGSLPRWRNPPGSVPHHQIPPVSFNGYASVVGSSYNHKTSCMVKGLGSSLDYSQNMVDFGSANSAGSCLMGGKLMMPSAVNFDSQISKRQRIQ